MNADWRNRFEVAVSVTHQAGQLALGYFDRDIKVEWKRDESPVTIADREAEQLLRTTLLGAFPQDGFLGEEFGDTPGTSGFRWIVDPVDGTRNYVRNIPLWGTLVGLTYKSETIAGVVEVPALGHRYRALRGEGSFRGERRIHVSEVRELSKATMFYTALSWFERAGRRDDFLNLANRVQTQRGYGDFYGHVLVAQGSGDLMVEHGVHIWDVAAIQPIVEEAGGRFSNWDGGCDLERADVLVSNGRLHDEVLRMLGTGYNNTQNLANHAMAGAVPMDTKPVVIEGPDGPKIAGTRITIYDIYYYMIKGWHHSSIAGILGLSSHQVMEVMKYVDAHRDEVHAVHEEIEARIARGHPPEVQAKLDAINAKYEVLWADRRRSFLEDDDEGDSG